MYRLMPAAYRRQVADLAALLGWEREIFDPIPDLSGDASPSSRSCAA